MKKRKVAKKENKIGGKRLNSKPRKKNEKTNDDRKH